MVAVLAGACTSSGSDIAGPDDTPTAETVTAGPTETPTPEPVATPTVSDNDLIAAALAAYEADPQPEGTIAWDELDASVFEDVVSFTMCTWDGLTANDVIRDVKFVTTVDGDGTIEARNVQSSPTTGDCLNTQLIESAIATINFHDDYWASVALEPSSFNTDATADDLYTDFGFQNLESLAQRWTDDDVYLRGAPVGGLPDDVVISILWRSYQNDNDDSILGLVACRDLDPAYGLYREALLLDDFKGDQAAGTHIVDEYRLVPDPTTDLGWRIQGTDGLVWADCLRTDDWVGAINGWKPDPTNWLELEG